MKLKGEEISKEDELLRDGLRFYNTMGYPPALRDFAFLPNYPSPKTIKKYFGGWKDYISKINFPVPTRKKKDVDSFYLGDSQWMRNNHNYRVQMQTLHTKLWHWLVTHVGAEGLVPRTMLDQELIVFQWNKVDYCVSYLNIYTENYWKKLSTIKEVLEDMKITLINLNGNYQWWERTMHVTLGIEKLGNKNFPRGGS